MKKFTLLSLGHDVNLNSEEKNAFLTHCYEELYEAVFAIAYDFFGNVQDAEDQVADFFERMMRWPIARFQENENLVGYILTAAHRHCINSVKKRNRRKYQTEDTALGVSDPRAAIERNFIIKESLEVVMRAIALLPEPQREALMLRAEGLDHKEIAIRLGINESASTSRINRARQKLREILRNMRD